MGQAAGGTTVGALGDLTGYFLRRASSTFAADFALALAETGLTQVLFGILAVVAANTGINQGAAARLLGIQRGNMVLLVNQLVDAGLLDRRVAPGDRRAVVLSLTVAGEALFADCLPRLAAHERRMLARLSTPERRTLTALLARIVEP